MKHVFAAIVGMGFITQSVSACEHLERFLPSARQSTCIIDYALQTGDDNLPLQAVYSIEATGERYRVLDRSRQFDGKYLNGGPYQFKSEEGMDNGHLASEKLPGVDYHARFDVVNRIPMAQDINRAGGAWHKIEDYEREQATNRGQIISYSGVIYKGSFPEAFYKVLYQPSNHATAAFLIPNSNGPQFRLEHYVTSVRCIETKAGRAVMSYTDNVLKDIANESLHSLQVWTQGDGDASSGCTAQKPVAHTKEK